MTERRIEPEPDRDANDLAGVVDEYRRRRAPKDIVPQEIPADSQPLPVGPAEVTHTEVLTDYETGVPVAVDQFTNTDWVAEPVTPESLRKRGIHLR
ncbi:hypothetical protein [Mycobacterium conspicuum]|uniref:Uncharacterized protein n=1 Tax=Mycobacterium conspicuum TaxID=44010 RepID=A0A1X1ST84_9MYCO|nr:hypothetical protein [Mycobacterium conspicuum]ORV33946.1 hypothetical protein AWC00_26660 [Mycobacterium conspicuum]BBZ38575.1 hypothetical protein MCNS_16380 [Mycobacterium conspicuum]